MSIDITSFTIGPMGNNSYLLADPQQKIAAIVDPSFGSKKVMDYCEKNQLKITDIFCTHAHFDHIAGINEIYEKLDKNVKIWLHADDLPLWKMNGGADYFNFPFEISCQPTNFVVHQESDPVWQRPDGSTLNAGSYAGACCLLSQISKYCLLWGSCFSAKCRQNGSGGRKSSDIITKH